MTRTARMLVIALLLGGTACTGSPTHRTASSRPPSSTDAAAGPTRVSYADLCGGGGGCPTGGVPASLRRALHPPPVTAGECPVTQPVRQVSPDVGPAQGPGPIYPAGADAHGVLSIVAPSATGSVYPSGWGGAKVLWVGAPSYTGPALIRGVRLDADSPVAFQLGGGNPALTEMQFPPAQPANTSSTSWRNWPSATLLKTPGCYAWQIDGSSFSTIVVFKAEPAP